LNLAGKPLCNTMEDAFSILDNTQLDYLVWKHRGEFYIEG
jgi:predicted NodU family carbamoyl transferase